MAFQIEPNILLLTDSYKPTHWPQYEPGTTRVSSFFESRGGRWPATLFFGLQGNLKSYFTGQVVTREKIDEARELLRAHLGSPLLFNREGWEYILREHGGRLPVEIRAVPEGTIVPVSNVLMTIENTDPRVPWLTNYLETLLVQAWYPTTVATQSHFMKQDILYFLEKTGDPGLIDFKLHDFGFRGVSSVETAGIGAAAHLVSFQGTDTIQGLRYAQAYYDAPMAGFSIPASEHSTMTSWGRDREVEAYRNMLRIYPQGTFACVSDSFNIFDACEKLWGGELRDLVLNREGTLVVRPDSGDPISVLLRVLSILGERFGFEVNAKGFKVLNPKVRVIQGDGIDWLAPRVILAALAAEGWSADNLAFGSGGGLLQKLDRDTQKFAFKCSEVVVDGVQRSVMKDPVTDPGKKSKAGQLALIRHDNQFRTVDRCVAGDSDLLIPVFRNGELLVDQTFDEIRHRAAQS